MALSRYCYRGDPAGQQSSCRKYENISLRSSKKKDAFVHQEIPGDPVLCAQTYQRLQYHRGKYWRKSFDRRSKNRLPNRPAENRS